MAAALLCSQSALADDPEAAWGAFPGAPAEGLSTPPPPLSAPPPPVHPPPVYSPPAWAPSTQGRGAAVTVVPPPPPAPPNTVSMLGAPTLGAGRRGQLLYLGYPLLTMQAAFGVTEWLDLGLGFDTFYGAMNEPRALARFRLLGGEDANLALMLEGGYAFFADPPGKETLESRTLTGRRNINFATALRVGSGHPPGRRVRLYLELRYELSLDLEARPTGPLGGVPPAVVPGHAGGLHGGAEVPLSETVSVVFQVGFDVHLRPSDATVMPAAGIGVVTGI